MQSWTDESRRFDWTVRTENLLTGIDPERTYDIDELLAALAVADVVTDAQGIRIKGSEVKQHLMRLIRDVSDVTVVPVAAVHGEMLTADELAARWNVSSKTLTR